MSNINKLVSASLGIYIKKLNETEKNEFNKIFKDTTIRKNDIVYALIDNNKYVGGITYSELISPTYRKFNIKPEIVIGFFYVLPKYRKKGFGKQLLNLVISKYKRIALSTNDSYTNNIAKNLYLKYGFKVVSNPKNKVKYWYLEK